MPPGFFPDPSAQGRRDVRHGDGESPSQRNAREREREREQEHQRSTSLAILSRFISLCQSPSADHPGRPGATRRRTCAGGRGFKLVCGCFQSVSSFVPASPWPGAVGREDVVLTMTRSPVDPLIPRLSPRTALLWPQSRPSSQLSADGLEHRTPRS